ncbi:MAG: histidine kinase [bacterium]|nr:histidine kinase [bacterium]
MKKVAVGQHHFIRSFLPALVMVLLATALVLLGNGVLMERQLEGMARNLAQRVTPGSHVALELDLAVGQFALATVLSAQSGDERGIYESEDRLDSAATAYDGWAHAVGVAGFRDVAPYVKQYEEHVAVANPHGARIDPREIEGALDDVSDVLRASRGTAALGATHMLDEIAQSQQRRRWGEMGVMALLAGGCLALLIAARRREERCCADEFQTVRNLEQVNADLEAFAGRVAHDLRNPLVPILSGSQVIEHSDVDANVKRAAGRIERSARRLSSMIDMLLDFSRIAGAHERARCHVPPIVEDVVDGFRDKARAHGVTLEVSCDDVHAACEPIVVASPLQNLIENAFKYGRSAGCDPVIEVRAFYRAGMVLIEVEDRGPGIDAAQAESLFSAFQRGVDGGEGIGLGLATARRLVEARGGSIGLRAGRFGGALFQIRLPGVPGEPKNDDEHQTATDVRP